MRLAEFHQRGGGVAEFGQSVLRGTLQLDMQGGNHHIPLRRQRGAGDCLESGGSGSFAKVGAGVGLTSAESTGARL